MSGKIRFNIPVVFAVLLLMPQSLVLADLVNGDFSAGLSGWTLEWGTVTDGGGYALFEEDAFDLSSTLSQEFTIPALALELSFDVQMFAVPGGSSDPFAWPDAFTATLYNDPVNLVPLISNPLVDDFYYLDNTGWEETVATVSGNTVSLDISSLAGLDAYLVFDLWGSDDGWLTSVNVDNVDISLVPTPSALLLGLIGMGTGVLGLWRRFNKSA
ncbi:hypothetical protein ES703_63942 [subsurface metagenome]